MISFKSLNGLSKLPPDDPTYPIIEELARKLLVTTGSMDRLHDPAADGWLALVEEADVERPLTEIWGEDAYSLIDTPWEGVTRQDGFYVAVFLANNQFGLVFIIPDEPWLPDELRKVLDDNLVPAPDKSTT